eukprot:XP_001706684.1 Hypothetical protein GL50803_98799 [Giardia lamblia ATCC 50803]
MLRSVEASVQGHLSEGCRLRHQERPSARTLVCDIVQPPQDEPLVQEHRGAHIGCDDHVAEGLVRGVPLPEDREQVLQ